MRCVIQRVNRASVSVNGDLVSQIEKGVLILIGITQADNSEDVDYVAKKVISLKLFPEKSSGKDWKESVKSLNLEILSVSQFTLFGKTCKGSKPDFHKASKGLHSKPLYEEFISKLKMLYLDDKIKDGVFGEMMNVSLENDGPVTVIIDSKDKEL
jgi:D-aminoacyl-tRNA deacylase